METILRYIDHGSAPAKLLWLNPVVKATRLHSTRRVSESPVASICDSSASSDCSSSDELDASEEQIAPAPVDLSQRVPNPKRKMSEDDLCVTPYERAKRPRNDSPSSSSTSSFVVPDVDDNVDAHFKRALGKNRYDNIFKDDDGKNVASNELWESLLMRKSRRVPSNSSVNDPYELNDSIDRHFCKSLGKTVWENVRPPSNE